MKKNPKGAPKKPPERLRDVLVQMRVTVAEKEAFQVAADLDGKKLSEWMRDRLRRDSRQELQDSGREVPFLSR